jgi:hypothetical protein
MRLQRGREQPVQLIDDVFDLCRELVRTDRARCAK